MSESGAARPSGEIHHRRTVVERLQYDRRRSRPSIDGLYGSLGGQTRSWSQIYMGGNEKLVGRGWRQLSDTVFTLNPSTRVTGYVEMLAAVEKRVAWGYDSWYGWATA